MAVCSSRQIANKITVLSPIPFSRRAALFEPPPKMIEEAWSWVSRVYAGMCLRRLRAFGFATPQQILGARLLLQEQIARISKDLAEYKDVKDVVQEAEISKRLAYNYLKPIIVIRISKGQFRHHSLRIDTSNPVWWNAFSSGEISAGGNIPPKFLVSLRRLLEGSLMDVLTTSPQQVTEMARLLDKLGRLSGGIEYSLEKGTKRDFDIDISGWQYGVEVPENWLQYTLILEPYRNPRAVGLWVSKLRQIIGYLGDFLEPVNRTQLEEFQHELRSTLEHELVHLSQSLLKAMRVLKEEPGLVSRRVRPTKIYDIHGHPPGWENMSYEEREKWEEEHFLQEIEFQPYLQDEVRDFRRIASRLQRNMRRLLLRAWVLPFDKAKPMEPIPNEWWKVVKLVKGHGLFFKALFQREHLKWRNAVSKFIKSVEDLL